MNEVEIMINGFPRINFDMGRVIQSVFNHPAKVLSIPAFNVIFPYHPVFVQTFAGHKKVISGYKILIEKCANKHGITEVLTNFEDKFLAFTGAGIKAFSLICIQKTLKFITEFSLVGHFFDIVKQMHSQGIRVQSYPGQGSNGSIHTSEIHFMPLDTLVL